MSQQEDVERYVRAQHAMQTGVSMDMQYNPTQAQPKHLRVGVNTAQCDHAALVRLLVQKGIISDDEYAAAIADEMEREVERYQQRISQQLGGNIDLA